MIQVGESPNRQKEECWKEWERGQYFSPFCIREILFWRLPTYHRQMDIVFSAFQLNWIRTGCILHASFNQIYICKLNQKQKKHKHKTVCSMSWSWTFWLFFFWIIYVYTHWHRISVFFYFHYPFIWRRTQPNWNIFNLRENSLRWLDEKRWFNRNTQNARKYPNIGKGNCTNSNWWRCIVIFSIFAMSSVLK